MFGLVIMRKKNLQRQISNEVDKSLRMYDQAIDTIILGKMLNQKPFVVKQAEAILWSKEDKEGDFNGRDSNPYTPGY